MKRERIKRKIYKNREAARQDIFNYIEMFYNPVRRHGSNDNISPVEYEKKHATKVLIRVLISRHNVYSPHE